MFCCDVCTTWFCWLQVSSIPHIYSDTMSKLLIWNSVWTVLWDCDLYFVNYKPLFVINTWYNWYYVEVYHNGIEQLAHNSCLTTNQKRTIRIWIQLHLGNHAENGDRNMFFLVSVSGPTVWMSDEVPVYEWTLKLGVPMGTTLLPVSAYFSKIFTAHRSVKAGIACHSGRVS